MYVVPSYTFAPGKPGVGTITIPGTLNIEDFGVITNVTRNSIIYNPAEGQAGASVSYGMGSTTLVLEQGTTYCSSQDKLQIIILQSFSAEGATEETLLSVDSKLPELVSGKIPVDIGTNIDVTIENTSIEISNTASNPVPVSDAGGSITVDAVSLPLPTGASTSAKQDTGNSSLSSIDGKLPALSGGKIPVEVGEVEIKNDSGNPVPVSGTVNTLEGLNVPAHDFISLGYTGGNLTSVVYKTGGSGGVTVATLALSYDGSNNLVSVTKS